MSTASTRPLPGIRFEVAPAAIDDPLPRMDVAVLVGFASSGPIDWPVAVESVAEFRAIFGADVPLAWDSQLDRMQYSLLGPALAQFFANGGRRCWVIRVAGAGARYNYYPLPGLLQARYDAAGHIHSVAPAFVRAAARGSASDGLRLACALRRQPMPLLDPWDGEHLLRLPPGLPDVPQPGDVLSLRDDTHRITVLAAVAYAAGGNVRIARRIAFADFPPPMLLPLTIHGRAWVYTSIRHQPADSRVLPPPGRMHPFSRRVRATLQGAEDDSHCSLLLHLAPDQAPSAGAWVRFDAGGRHHWLIVQQVQWLDDGVRVLGRVWQQLPLTQVLPQLRASQAVNNAERLTLDLRAESVDGVVTRERLGLASGHAAYLQDLPGDDEYFRASDAPPRFAVAGCDAQRTLCLPLAVGPLFGAMPGALHQPGSPLQRAGLEKFSAALFLDPDLADVGSESLQDQADRLRYLGPGPRPLKGLHAALGFAHSPVAEEATLIAVPDAQHRHWHPAEPQPPAPAHAEQRIAFPRWWHARPCPLPEPLPLLDQPPQDEFLACDVRLLPAPVLNADGPNALGTVRLWWQPPEPGWDYLLQEANQPDFSDARQVYAGSATEVTFYGRPPGDYYFRLRATAGANGSHWSAPLVLRVSQPVDAELERSEDYSDDDLRRVQIALLRLAAARGDWFACLALPQHYREADAQRHAALLQTPGDGADPHWLGPDEGRALSFGALYHPWAIGTHLQAAPPDGLALAQLARRAIERGAWIAPANLPLRDIVALAPAMHETRRLVLQQAQLNLLRQDARGFLVLSADTLSLDPDLRPINVRRLLSLLRRVALQRGQLYVFEPLSDLFRRSVQRGFEQLLNELFRRGAFAGNSPAQAFRVEVGLPPNNVHDLDNGRFFVELKVAPSQPLAFLTVRLLQLGERLQAQES